MKRIGNESPSQIYDFSTKTNIESEAMKVKKVVEASAYRANYGTVHLCISVDEGPEISHMVANTVYDALRPIKPVVIDIVIFVRPLHE